MRTLILAGAAVAALAAALAGAATAQDHSKMKHGAMSSSAMADAGPALPTPDFLMAAGQSDQFEIQSGRLAAERGKAQSVKSFGKMMTVDHMKTTKSLMAAVKASGMSPPPPPPLKPEQQAMLDELNGKSGMDFDKTYVSQQLMAHQEALSAQSGYAAGGDMPKIKGAAKMTVPIVQSHIKMLNGMQTKMGG